MLKEAFERSEVEQYHHEEQNTKDDDGFYRNRRFMVMGNEVQSSRFKVQSLGGREKLRIKDYELRMEVRKIDEIRNKEG